MADPAAAAYGAGAAQPPPPDRPQSSTSLSRLYHGANGGPQHEDLTDPSLDFCNAFWGQGDRGYEVVMARLRGAARTVDELKVFWKERAAIEEEYAKKLSKLAKMRLGGDEIGDLAASLQTIQAETSAQASYHLQLSTELHQTVEQPTIEFGNRLANLRKGQQASVEKSWRNKGLQEGHVAKARERYEKDCLKLNSYTANMQLVQGRERDELEAKMDKTRRSIVGEEQDFRNFVSVLEQTTQKWENEWRNFCDLVQDIEEERLVLTKDIVWSFANAVSQVCVEDDSSCERVREKLEMFEPVNDMVYFVKGWGTGDQIPDAPRFINYGMGEYPTQPTSHAARFRRLSDKPPLQPVPRQVPEGADDVPQEGLPPHADSIPPAQGDAPPPVPRKEGEAPTGDMQRMNLGETEPPSSEPPSSGYKPPFGIAMPGMAAAGAAAAGAAAAGGFGGAGSAAPSSGPGDMGPPPVPASLSSAAGPPSPSARDVQDNEDPMARALAELRRDPPGPNSVRRAPSQRRPESLYTGGSIYRPGSAAAQQQQQQQQPGQPQSQPQRAPSPSPSLRTQASYQAPTLAQGRSSMESGLIPPASGHTAAALAKSMADFENRSQNRNSVNYQNYADNLVGAHPSSRPSSPSGQPARAPSPAMMQPPKQPTQHIADDVVPRYHQAFPGERSRSRPASVYSSHSRAGSIVDVPPPSHDADEKPREGFVGIGAGNAARSPSPGPGSYRSPSPNPSGSGGVLGQPNLGIALDASGGVAQDSMAEQYRRQYEQQRQQHGGPPHDSQPPQQPPNQAAQPQAHQQPQERHSSVYSNYSGQQHYGQQQPQQQSDPYNQHQRSQSQTSFSQQSQYGAHPQAAPYAQQQQQQYGQPPAQPQQPQQQQQPQAYGHYVQPQQGQPQQGQPQHPQQQAYAQQQPPQQQPQQQQYPRHGTSPSQSFMQPPQQAAPPAQQHPPAQQYDYRQQQNGYGAYPQQGQQQQQPPQQQGYRVPSPQPQQHDYRAPSPQPQAYAPPLQQQQAYRAPSPQPQAQQQYQQQQQQPAQRNTPSPRPNQPPANIVPTGQWASNGLPVLFYVRALYDYQAQSSVEFDFQEGDIIAVTSHPEDGWWSGELLDEARNMPGRTDFPSNFVTLF